MNLLTIILLAAIVSDPKSEQMIVREQVGWIEQNQVIDAESGRLKLAQIIFWDIDPYTGRNECRGWLPSDRAIVVGARVIVVRSKTVYLIDGAFLLRTRTFHDPEIENRKIIPLDQRRLVAAR